MQQVQHFERDPEFVQPGIRFLIVPFADQRKGPFLGGAANMKLREALPPGEQVAIGVWAGPQMGIYLRSQVVNMHLAGLRYKDAGIRGSQFARSSLISAGER